MDIKDNSESSKPSKPRGSQKNNSNSEQYDQQNNNNPNLRKNNNNGVFNNNQESQNGGNKQSGNQTQRNPQKNSNETGGNRNKNQVVYVRVGENQGGNTAEEQKVNPEQQQQNQLEGGQNGQRNNLNRRNNDRPKQDINQNNEGQQSSNRRQGNQNRNVNSQNQQGGQGQKPKPQGQNNQQRNEFSRGKQYNQELQEERTTDSNEQTGSEKEQIGQQNSKAKKLIKLDSESFNPNQVEDTTKEQLPQKQYQSRTGGNQRQTEKKPFKNNDQPTKNNEQNLKKSDQPFKKSDQANQRVQQSLQNRKVRNEERQRREEQEGDQEDQDIIDDGGAADDGEDLKFDISKENKNTLRETLIKRLKRKKIDCPICYEKIGLRSSTWSCVQCYHPFHLECLKKWIVNSNKDKKNVTLYNWSCPNCQYIYNDKMPIYYCFCGKFKNPEFDPYINPHSCGDTCGKKRGNNCTHPCDAPCHPGPCPPCTLKGEPIKCYCKKSKKDVNCSDNQTAYECGSQCAKKLNCGKHLCDRNCHSGDCNKCTEKVEAVCFCGSQKKSAICGQDLFTCNKTCNKTLSCGNHKCLSQCHPGPCGECELNPEDVDTCPCGKISLLTLTGGNFRETCNDPIPVCGGPCKKMASCGVHSCKRSCHEGPCPPCKESVEEMCRCKFSGRVIQCYELRDPDHKEFICDRVCKKLKSCNVHPCNTPCCPARKGQDVDGVHLCLKVCEKPLNCGKHNCELFCHLGICNKCPIKIYDPITCVCGKTSLQPPQSCGTKLPECHEPCSRQKNCGHPCHLDCHSDECPPCEYKVDKVCHCGRQTVQNVSCSKDALCTISCSKIMSCGHKCETVCHVDNCPKDNPELGCGRKCGRKRKFCEHVCISICHGQTECPIDPCKVEVVIKCKCGEREAFVECGSSDSALDRTLACNELCKNISRFSRFHDKNKIYYPALLIRFAKYNMVYLLKIEKKAESFIKSDETELTIPFQNDIQKKLGVQSLLGKHYHLNVQYYNHFKQPYFVIEKSSDMVIPKMPLSEYYRKVEKGEIKPEVLPFEASIRFNVSVRDDPNQVQLDQILRDFPKEYYIEKEDRSLVLQFWDKSKAEMASKRLKKSASYCNFTLEINERLAREEESQLTAPNEVTRVKKRIVVQSQPEVPQHSDDEEEKQLKLNKEKSHVVEQRLVFQDKACLYEMCSEKEIEERNSRMLIDIFEQDPRTAQMQPFVKWMIKTYLRASELNSQPESIRPPDVLLLTTKYIVNKILDANFYANVPFKYPRDRQGKRRSHTFDDIYNFASDRFKAIRQDITILNESTEESIYALEIICRFYSICLYECQTMEQSYDMKILIDDLQSSLSQLLQMYKDIPHYNYLENKYEIYFYTLILNATDEIFINAFLVSIPDPDHPKIKLALQFIDAVKNLDYFNFFLVVKQFNYIETCVAFNLFSYIRRQAVAIMRKSRLALTVSELKDLFYFDSIEQTIQFLKAIGLDTTKISLPDEYETDNEEEEKLKAKKALEINQENDLSVQNDNVVIQEQPKESQIEASLNENQTDIVEQQPQKEESLEKPIEEDQGEEQKENKEEEQPPKKYKLKKVNIDWKIVYENNETNFKELNLNVSNKKTIEYYPGYKQIKATNNENIVTRAYLVMGVKQKNQQKQIDEKEVNELQQ